MHTKTLLCLLVLPAMSAALKHSMNDDIHVINVWLSLAVPLSVTVATVSATATVTATVSTLSRIRTVTTNARC